MHVKSRDLTTLKQVLNQIQDSAKDKEEVSLEDILQVTGRRSFGPILLLAGIITLAPLIGDIPGVPTMIAIVVFLTTVQLIMNQKKLWLPAFILKKSLNSDKLRKAIKKIEKPTKYIDRFLKPRLTILTNGWMVYVIAFICLCIALIMPVLEFIPFSANFAGLALTAFGLSMIAQDGLLAAFGYIFTAMIAGFILYHLI